MLCSLVALVLSSGCGAGLTSRKLEKSKNWNGRRSKMCHFHYFTLFLPFSVMHLPYSPVLYSLILRVLARFRCYCTCDFCKFACFHSLHLALSSLLFSLFMCYFTLKAHPNAEALLSIISKFGLWLSF